MLRACVAHLASVPTYTPPTFGGIGMGRVAARGHVPCGAGPSLPPARLWAVPVELVASGTCVWPEANALSEVGLLWAFLRGLRACVATFASVPKPAPPCGPFYLGERLVAALWSGPAGFSVHLKNIVFCVFPRRRLVRRGPRGFAPLPLSAAACCSQVYGTPRDWIPFLCDEQRAPMPGWARPSPFTKIRFVPSGSALSWRPSG